jgi:hypothetical protein
MSVAFEERVFFKAEAVNELESERDHGTPAEETRGGGGGGGGGAGGGCGSGEGGGRPEARTE